MSIEEKDEKTRGAELVLAGDPGLALLAERLVEAARSGGVGRGEGSGDTELLGNLPWRRGCRHGWTVSAGVP